MKKRIVLRIFGRVQGVFYRINTNEKALELNLTGFVHNKNDGTVETVAEGEESDLKEFIKWCYKGSSSSRVEKIEEKWEEYTGGFNNFEIKY